jgi:hypothetical protein
MTARIGQLRNRAGRCLGAVQLQTLEVAEERRCDAQTPKRNTMRIARKPR